MNRLEEKVEEIKKRERDGLWMRKRSWKGGSGSLVRKGQLLFFLLLSFLLLPPFPGPDGIAFAAKSTTANPTAANVDGDAETDRSLSKASHEDDEEDGGEGEEEEEDLSYWEAGSWHYLTIPEAEAHAFSGGDFVRDGKETAYLLKSGKYLSRTFARIKGALWYFDERGHLLKKGIVKVGVRMYAAGADGKLLKESFFSLGGETYYAMEDYKLANLEWVEIQGEHYYFRRDGILVKDAWVSNSYVDQKGKRVLSKTVDGRVLKNGRIEQISKKDRFVIVGASRVVDMSAGVSALPETKKAGVVFLCRSGQGYSWLIRYASSQLEGYLESNPELSIVFQLGNNDMENAERYISFYRAFFSRYPSAKFYLMDALPGKYEDKRIRSIAFNKKMKKAFGARCIGGYDYLCDSGYTLLDKSHYDLATNQRIFRYVMRKIDPDWS